MKSKFLALALLAALAGCDDDGKPVSGGNASILAENGRRVSVHYTGKLQDGGKVFDSSHDRGKPFTFTLGQRQVIPCWEEGVLGMKVGDKKELICSPDKAYGSAGAGNGLIPPNATLIFDVELMGVE